MLAREVAWIETCRHSESLLYGIPPTTDLNKVIPDLCRLHAGDQARDVRLVQVEHATSYLHAY